MCPVSNSSSGAIPKTTTRQEERSGKKKKEKERSDFYFDGTKGKAHKILRQMSHSEALQNGRETDDRSRTTSFQRDTEDYSQKDIGKSNAATARSEQMEICDDQGTFVENALYPTCAEANLKVVSDLLKKSNRAKLIAIFESMVIDDVFDQNTLIAIFEGELFGKDSILGHGTTNETSYGPPFENSTANPNPICDDGRGALKENDIDPYFFQNLKEHLGKNDCMSLLNLIKGASNKTYDAIFRDNLEEVADLFVGIPDREAKENFQRAFERHIKRNYSFSNDLEVKKRMIRNHYEKIREDKFSIAALFCAVPQEEVLKADRDAFDSMGFLEFLQKIIDNQMAVSEGYLFERFRKAIKTEEREDLLPRLLYFFESKDKIKDPLVREHVWSLCYQTLFNEINIKEIGWKKPGNAPPMSLEEFLEKADSKTLCALALEKNFSSSFFYDYSDLVAKGFSEELKSKFDDYQKDPSYTKGMLISIWGVDNSSALEDLLGDRGEDQKYLAFLCSFPDMEKKVPCLSENSARYILRNALKNSREIKR